MKLRKTTIMIQEDYLEFLKKYAFDHHMSMSGVVRQLLDKFQKRQLR